MQCVLWKWVYHQSLKLGYAIFRNQPEWAISDRQSARRKPVKYIRTISNCWKGSQIKYCFYFLCQSVGFMDCCWDAEKISTNKRKKCFLNKLRPEALIESWIQQQMPLITNSFSPSCPVPMVMGVKHLIHWGI